MIKGIIAIIIIILGSVVFFLLRNKTVEETSSPMLFTVTIAGSSGNSALPIFLAQERGYFKQEGLDVVINTFEAGRLAGENLMAGKADFAVMTDFAFVNLLTTNEYISDLKILADIATFRHHELLARKDKGISQPSDLKGKKVGITEGTSAHFFLGRFLVRNGLKLADVVVVNLTPTALIDAISGGDIDAVLIWEPNVYKIKERLGANVINWPAQGAEKGHFLLVSKEEWVNNNTDTVSRVLKALVKAEEAILSEKDKSKAFLQHRAGYNQEYVDRLWPSYQFSVSLSQELILALEEYDKWNIKNKIGSPKTFNSLGFIYLDGLEKIKPEAVTIFR